MSFGSALGIMYRITFWFYIKYCACTAITESPVGVRHYTVCMWEQNRLLLLCTAYTVSTESPVVFIMLCVYCKYIITCWCDVLCQEAKYVERWPNTASAWAGWSRFDIPVDRYGRVRSLLICTSITLGSSTCHQASQQGNTYWAKYQKAYRASALVTLWFCASFHLLVRCTVLYVLWEQNQLLGGGGD